VTQTELLEIRRNTWPAILYINNNYPHTYGDVTNTVVLAIKPPPVVKMKIIHCINIVNIRPLLLA